MQPGRIVLRTREQKAAGQQVTRQAARVAERATIVSTNIVVGEWVSESNGGDDEDQEGPGGTGRATPHVAASPAFSPARLFSRTASKQLNSTGREAATTGTRSTQQDVAQSLSHSHRRLSSRSTRLLPSPMREQQLLPGSRLSLHPRNLNQSWHPPLAPAFHCTRSKHHSDSLPCIRLRIQRFAQARQSPSLSVQPVSLRCTSTLLFRCVPRPLCAAPTTHAGRQLKRSPQPRSLWSPA
ncbi:hypothetical protein OH76DRAFT_522122 [Lentinus brumalis]|uniref:Uncharacterized protein n=1 Tax=Lentinus brumalis TaxID=2498619 RepID=A0A371DAT4_9APHY|nr:hypothetical protein OH76DRAFT_522122 [Polyporus brumalis]